MHTLLRLPTGIFYAGGVKANVLFFDKRPARPGQPWTERLWVYDLRTNQHFTQKQNPLRRSHLDEFVECFAPGKRRSTRTESERWRPYDYEELLRRESLPAATVGRCRSSRRRHPVGGRAGPAPPEAHDAGSSS